MPHHILGWIIFNVIVLGLLSFDLFLFHKNPHKVGIREALIGSAFWIGLALAFGAGVYFFMGHEPALNFLTGYVIEESLSVDNLFVFLVIFSYFKVPDHLQHRVLFWGILGALIMRAIFIMAGVTLIHKFHWIIFVFGAFLIFTGYKLVFGKEKEIEPEKSLVLKIFRRFMPVTNDYHGNRFFVRHAGKLSATPLMIVLLIIESTDVLFAVDSIPAVLSISHDPFIVYTSNIFAILGLRSLYFALSGLMGLFRYLNYGLGVILAFVGVKMLLSDFYKIPVGAALSIIAGVLSLSIALSVFIPQKPDAGKHSH